MILSHELTALFIAACILLGGNIACIIEIIRRGKKIKDLERTVQDVKHGRNERLSKEESGTDTESLCNGMVRLKTSRSGSRVSYTYEITDQFPELKNIDEALSFATGILSQVEDPTIANILPYGYVMKTEKYLATMTLLKNVFREIHDLLNETKETQEEKTNGEEEHNQDDSGQTGEENKHAQP